MKSKKPERLPSEIKSARSRALYQAERGAVPKIELTFTTYEGDTTKFELEVAQTAKLVEEIMASYNAIMPPLKTSRGGFGL